MWEKSRQMLLLEAPGTGSDDTVRGTLYESWILAQADQMINPHGKTPALPNLIEQMGKPSVSGAHTLQGLSAAPDNLYWAYDHFLSWTPNVPGKRTPQHLMPMSRNCISMRRLYVT